ncbi:DUF3052 domain-containing protein [Lysobacter arvi]|uniref:DUF3052 domain-containing protein n=1 Tax=Lysobacter arvi TaxID=3038776 RepID=A0ABU1CHQ2_9GAMM|nr:DUF3052 domain-containing protein [Lysobacter arvi]MDR0184481.1 DUF3052 domain-containing protein [Lysobacter arvi]
MAASRASGYSGTPLAKKLGVHEGARVWTLDAPEEYRTWLAPLPPGVRFAAALDGDVGIAHLFCTRRAVLADALAKCRRALASDATVWVSWPKKAAKVPTDITEDTIRALALPLGFVDVKVCAVDAVWSGLKLVVRKELR